MPTRLPCGSRRLALFDNGYQCDRSVCLLKPLNKVVFKAVMSFGGGCGFKEILQTSIFILLLSLLFILFIIIILNYIYFIITHLS